MLGIMELRIELGIVREGMYIKGGIITQGVLTEGGEE